MGVVSSVPDASSVASMASSASSEGAASFGRPSAIAHWVGAIHTVLLSFHQPSMAYLHGSWQFWAPSSMYDIAAWSSYMVGEVAALIVVLRKLLESTTRAESRQYDGDRAVSREGGWMHQAQAR